MNNTEKHLFKQFLIENKIRKKFISYFDSKFYNPGNPYSIRKYLNKIYIEQVFIFAFCWADTKEKMGYWSSIDRKFIDYCNKCK